MKVSIVCPIYTMSNGKSKKFLIEYLSQFFYQTYKDFEIVLSDQSNDIELKKISEIFSECYDIKYVVNNSTNKCAANNVNYALKHTSGDIIKLLYMDDFFVDNNALSSIVDEFKNNSGSWLISGFVHCDEDRNIFYDARTPWYGNKFPNGDNTTGNPSTYAVRKECAIEMDENLLWIVDGEYFYRSYYHYGDPIIIKKVQVCFREHTSSAFRDPKFQELDTKERQYVLDKYSKLPQRG